MSVKKESNPNWYRQYNELHRRILAVVASVMPKSAGRRRRPRMISCPDGKRTPVQRIDAMGNERQAHDRFDGPNYQMKVRIVVVSEILYKKERKRRDREIKDGGCAQKNTAVGAIHAESATQQFADCLGSGGREWGHWEEFQSACSAGLLQSLSVSRKSLNCFKFIFRRFSYYIVIEIL